MMIEYPAGWRKLAETPMKRISVPSGSYSISKSKGEILEAFLGTCVGVTLIDHDADVGGLIHLLLPEPTANGLWQPENYASIGLPIFIKTLCEAGASKERHRVPLLATVRMQGQRQGTTQLSVPLGTEPTSSMLLFGSPELERGG